MPQPPCLSTHQGVSIYNQPRLDLEENEAICHRMREKHVSVDGDHIAVQQPAFALVLDDPTSIPQ
jgi:hypothetical protein